ncbi:N-carbamoylputrescine amidase [Desulfobotulus alkaliphilus]|uniref:N-carbamoylputrescine amidase n=1 Tax=Desulfobotulus alkaliphilus TaxID=622671 RepID=A0A562R3B2_9BACT|nr:nitrilase-related carbon-nitrogen hydrolase [Desulfobotulus alkaliphilus]TWI62856.1 N-carbamoylputrescine amidase [Desulfobotulus alkaliphilus]
MDHSGISPPDKDGIITGLALAPQFLGDVQANLATLSSFCERADAAGVDILVFPEMHLTGYPTRKEDLERSVLGLEEAISMMAPLASRWNLVLVAGFAEKSENRFFVTQLALGPDGILAIYRKIHLGPPERSLYTAGDQTASFRFMGMHFAIALCYDAHFPELFSHLASQGADVFLIPHASPRGTPQDKKSSWLRHLPARAFDTGSYVLVVNPLGSDGAGKSFPGLALGLGPDGRIFGELGTENPDLLVLNLHAERVKALRSHPMTAFHRARRPELYGKWMQV